MNQSYTAGARSDILALLLTLDSITSNTGKNIGGICYIAKPWVLHCRGQLPKARPREKPED